MLKENIEWKILIRLKMREVLKKTATIFLWTFFYVHDVTEIYYLTQGLYLDNKWKTMILLA